MNALDLRRTGGLAIAVPWDGSPAVKGGQRDTVVSRTLYRHFEVPNTVVSGTLWLFDTVVSGTVSVGNSWNERGIRPPNRCSQIERNNNKALSGCCSFLDRKRGWA